MNASFFRATSLLAGTIIGAGLFSLPYLFARLGWVWGFVYLVGFAFVYLAVHLMYVSLVVREADGHHFLYLVRRYLPRFFARVISWVVPAGLLLALVAYLTLAPHFARLAFGGGGTSAVIGLWLLGSLFMFLGVARQGWAELVGVAGIVGLIGFVFFSGSGSVSLPVFVSLDTSLFLLPFGAFLFSFVGRAAIAEVVGVYQRSVKKFSLQRAIFFGTLIPVFVYFVFIFGVLRLNPTISPQSFLDLALPAGVLRLLGLLGFVVLFTSYFMIGENVKDILRTDVGRSQFFSGAVPVAVPILLYTIGFRDFLTVISFAGGIFLAIESACVVFMWRRAFPASSWRWVSWPLYAVFVTAVVSVVWGVAF